MNEAEKTEDKNVDSILIQEEEKQPDGPDGQSLILPTSTIRQRRPPERYGDFVSHNWIGPARAKAAVNAAVREGTLLTAPLAYDQATIPNIISTRTICERE